METDEKIEARVVELEVRLAYQEELLRQLDGVIREQADGLGRMEREIQHLREEFAQPTEAEPPMEDQVPPHY